MDSVLEGLSDLIKRLAKQQDYEVVHAATQALIRIQTLTYDVEMYKERLGIE